MFENLIQLIVLFFVIFDPPASFSVFLVSTKNMDKKEKGKVALLAVLVAFILSTAVLFLGEHLLEIFSTNIMDFKVAGGIILILLGIRMAFSHPIVNLNNSKDHSAKAIAAVIGTPLITGPAAITTIIVAVNDFGRVVTGTSILIVLSFTAILFIQSYRMRKFLSPTTIQVMSTIMGLITLSWGVKLIRAGIVF